MSKLTGCVKWFNNKAGYGFITVCDGDFGGKDIFVHHSAISSEKDEYVYLVQGEYVEFELVKPTKEDSKYEFNASNISGIKGGPIMCKSRVRAGPMAGSRKPRDVSTEEGDFTPVKGRRAKK
jgi:cold shock CspA family protein